MSSWGTLSKKDDQTGGLTKQTQALLEGVMKQRGISQRCLSDISQSIQRGDGKWIEHISTGTSNRKASMSKTQPLVKAPKVGRGPNHGPHACGMPPAR